MKRASTSCSSPGLWRSDSAFALATGPASSGGSTTKPSPHAGVQGLGERADVEHALRVRQAAQCGDAERPVLELAVVVVLDDPAAAGIRPVEHREPPRQAHAHAERELVRRRHDRQARARPARRGRTDRHAFRVDRHRTHRGAVSEQAGADALVARVLDQHLVAGVEQQPADQVDRLLRARHHDDLRRLAADAARDQQPLRDRAAQRQVAGRIDVARERMALARRDLAREALPDRKREHVDARVADAKGHRHAARRLPAQRGVGDQAAAPREQRRRRRRACRGAACADQPGGALGDVAAVADTRHHVAFRLQPLDRPEHGVARDAECLCMLARGRQARTGGEGAVFDRRAQALVDLLAQRHRAAAIGSGRHAELVPRIRRFSSIVRVH